MPEFIVEKIMLYTLLLDKGITKLEFNAKKGILCDSILSYMGNIDSGFVSDKSQEFKAYLEQAVGKVEFSRTFAVRIRPGSFRMFMDGKEIFG